MRTVPVYCPFCQDELTLRADLWSLCTCGTWLRVSVHLVARSDGPGEGEKDYAQLRGQVEE